MGYIYKTDDPVADAERYAEELYDESWIEDRPVCMVCGKHITDDYAIKYDDGLVCSHKDCRAQLAEWLLDDYNNAENTHWF